MNDLVEARRMLLLELLGESGVLDVGVEHDDAIVCSTESGERRPVRLAGRHALSPERIRRAPPRDAWAGAGRETRLRGGSRWQRRIFGDDLRLQFSERPLELVALLQRLAVPPGLPSMNEIPFPLIVLREHHRRTARRGASLRRARRASPQGRDRRLRCVCQPKARHRAASASMSCCHCVG